MVLDPTIDRRRVSLQYLRHTDEAMEHHFQRVNRDLGLSNTIPSPRVGTPSFSYYSTIQNSFSRIDHILVDEVLTPYVAGHGIDPVPWSDHDMVRITLALGWCEERRGRWKCNDALLRDEVLAQEILDSITEFFLV